MSISETTRVAMRALLRNRVRSSLTMLGVIIGVAAVVAMVAIGDGAKAKVQEAFASAGVNLLVIIPGTTTRGGAMGGFGSMPTLTWGDLQAIRTEIPTVRRAAAQLRITSQVLSDDQNWTTVVTGTSPEYFGLRHWALAQGIYFNSSDLDGNSKVAVLGQTVVQKLYGQSANPVGQVVRIRNIPFEIIGVLAAKGQSPMGQDYDDAIFVPESTFQSKIQGGLQQYINGVILAEARSSELAPRAEKQIASLLRDRHRIQPGMDDDFFIRSLVEAANAQEEGIQTLSILLASVAAVSLLVGGVGIMNIMLVSVAERTKEIGLRMAVGAKRRNILAQFLIESLALSLIGGFIGIGLGIFTATQMAENFGWGLRVRPEVLAMAVGFSALVGVAFGIYPARKASLLNPVEALRFEV